MATKIKFSFLQFLFRLFSKLSDATGGWRVFVKPKLWLGTFILGMGVTACVNTAKQPPQVTCYEPSIPDTVDTELVKPYSNLQTPPLQEPPPNETIRQTLCYFIEPVIPNDNEDVEMVEQAFKYQIPLNSPPIYATVITKKDTIYDENHIYDFVEQMPQFPGGDTELFKFINKEIQEEPLAMCYNPITGRVIVRFAVMKDGSIEQAKVIRSLDPSCDKEAIRVVNAMPKWIPGKQNGENVNVWFTIPINFKMQ